MICRMARSIRKILSLNAGEGSLADPYHTRRSSAWAFAAGIPLLFVALFFQTVTLTGGSYAAVLIIALALTGLADAFFIYAFRRGGIFARSLSVILLLPTLFVISDFLRRVPYLFDPHP